jgi:alkaline phosphatase
MKAIKFSIFFIPVVILLAVVTCKDDVPIQQADAPRNIILFIGDGMGVTHVTSAMLVSGSPLHMVEMPVVGLSKTCSSNRYATDSAAGGTAIASGVKTKNGMIGMNHDSISVESIVEIAARNGLATGVVSTAMITHATPAAFVAHNISRRNYEEIAVDFVNSKVDLFMGGGLDNFTKRKDSVDLVLKLKEKGFQVVTTPEEMIRVESGRLAGLFNNKEMPTVQDGRPVSLAAMTKKAIEMLSKNDKGFFLMVEGALIDYAGHDGDAEYLNSEMLDMDQAIGEALHFASQNKETLVIVTSDHETGGMAITGGNPAERTITVEWATTGHTATMVPIFAAGPGATRFGGVMENTEIFERMVMSLGIK